MSRAKFALASGLTLIAGGIGLTLAQAPPTVARSNEPGTEEQVIAVTTESATFCQARELLPAGTTAIRASLSAFTGPPIAVSVSAHGHEITSGSRGSGWTTRDVTVPVRPLHYAVANTTVCLAFHMSYEKLSVYGKVTSQANAARENGETTGGRLAIEYLRPGSRSWASLAGSISHKLGLARAAPGSWVTFAVLALITAIVAVTSRAVIEAMP